MNTPSQSDSVRHLVELGYEDPFDAAEREAAKRRRRDAQRAEAEALIASCHFDKAIALLEQLADEFPDWAAPHLRLAQTHVRGQQFAAARRHCQWLTYRGFESAALAILRATVELGERQFDAAIEQANYAKCLSDDSTSADAILGEAYVRRGDLDAATAAFERVFVARPVDANALGGMAAIALRRRDYVRTIDYALAALEQNLSLPAVHYRLGVALASLGRSVEARAALETSSRLDPWRAAPYRWLARLSAQRGETELARQMTIAGRERIRQRRRREAPTPPGCE
ncbi:MAG: hypothetical protein WD851_23240 [Pirellulales bacterium]